MRNFGMQLVKDPAARLLEKINWRDEPVVSRVAETIERDPSVQVLSLDFFDTLVFRLSPEPVHVFAEVGRRLRRQELIDASVTPEEFRFLREHAEAEARKEGLRYSGISEVTLPTIYHACAAVVRDPGEAVRIEVETERDFCVPNPHLLGLALWAKNRGLKIAVLSETYLGEEDLIGILEENGIQRGFLDLCLVSNRVGSGKWDGTMFRALAARLGVPPQAVVHIGDSEMSDIKGAELAGVRAFHYYRRQSYHDEVLLHERAHFPEFAGTAFGLDALRIHAQREMAPGEGENAFRSGAFLIGPVISPFIFWACTQFQQAGVRRVLALMREGQLFAELAHEATEALGIELEVLPFHTSRYATALASLGEASEKALRQRILTKTQRTVRDVVEFFGLGSHLHEFEPWVLEASSSNKSALSMALQRILQSHLKNVIEEESARVRGVVAAYLKQFDDGTGRLGILDLGWGGSIQRNLQRIGTLAGLGIRFVGRYLATDRRAGREVIQGLDLKGYLGHAGSHAAQLDSVFRSPEILEQAVNAPCGSTVGYLLEGSMVVPQLAPLYHSAEELALKEAIQTGIRRFHRWYCAVRSAKRHVFESLAEEEKSYARAVLHRMVTFPLRTEADCLGRLQHDDNYGDDSLHPICGPEHDALMVTQGIAGLYHGDWVYWPQGVVARTRPEIVRAMSLGWRKPEHLSDMGTGAFLEWCHTSARPAFLQGVRFLAREYDCNVVLLIGFAERRDWVQPFLETLAAQDVVGINLVPREGDLEADLRDLALIASSEDVRGFAVVVDAQVCFPDSTWLGRILDELRMRLKVVAYHHGIADQHEKALSRGVHSDLMTWFVAAGKRVGYRLVSQRRFPHYVHDEFLLFEREQLTLPTDPRGEAMDEEAYQWWLRRSSLQEIDAQLHAERLVVRWKDEPHFLLAFWQEGEGPADALAQTTKSLQSQLYKNWSAVVFVSDPGAIASPDPRIRIEPMEGRAPWVRRLLGIVGETGASWLGAFPLGTGFAPELMLRVGDERLLNPALGAVYADHDVWLSDGRRVDPWFKPDLNPQLMLSTFYTRNVVFFHRELLSGVDPETDIRQVGDATILALMAQKQEKRVGHLAGPCVHLPPNHRYTADGALLRRHLDKTGFDGTVEEGYLRGSFRLRRARPLHEISIVVACDRPAAYVRRLLESLSAYRTGGVRAHFIFVIPEDHRETDAVQAAIREFGGIPLFAPAGRGKAGLFNLGARQAGTEALLLMSSDIEVAHGDWLDTLVRYLGQPEVGVVGPRIVESETGRILDGGLVLGLYDSAASAFSGDKRLTDLGYMGLLQTDRNVSAVSDACLLTRQSVFQALGGFSEGEFAARFFDVDYCLRVNEAGRHVVWTPYVTLARHLPLPGEEESKNHEEAGEALRTRWLGRLADDPFYNRHLDLNHANWQLPTDLVVDWDSRFRDRHKVVGIPVPGGSGYYRMTAPLRALSKAGILQATFSQGRHFGVTRYPGVVELRRSGANVVYLQNAVSETAIRCVDSWRKHLPEVRILLSLDDLLTDIPETSSSRWRLPGAAKDLLKGILQRVDGVVVTTEPLVELCREHCKRVELIPNRISRTDWEQVKPRQREGGRPRVGWAGAQQHLGDLEWLVDVVRATSSELDWVFMGMCPENLRPYVAECHPFVLSVEDYPRHLAQLALDVAVAPLAYHPFNEAKSNLRLLEYGMLGWPVVCTDIRPYRDAPVIRVPNDPAQWIAAIRRLVQNPELARRQGAELREWVLSQYILEDHLEAWARLFLQ